MQMKRRDLSIYLHRKLPEIETLIGKHNPHVFALGEANILKEHNLDDLKIKNYELHTAKSIDNNEMKVARVAVYTHNSLVVKRREDLEDETVQTIWLEMGLPHQKKSLIMAGYRQW